ncbi:MAG: hypothetical protein IPJ00_13020 [Saprospirales bacterium]|nr:hypothetical protein [Saprospirales bacterium]
MKLPLLGFFLLMSYFTNGQKEDYVWVVGTGNDPDSIFSTTIINFNATPPLIDLKYKFNGLSWTNTNIST